MLQKKCAGGWMKRKEGQILWSSCLICYKSLYNRYKTNPFSPSDLQKAFYLYGWL